MSHIADLLSSFRPSLRSPVLQRPPVPPADRPPAGRLPDQGLGHGQPEDDQQVQAGPV